MNKQITESSLNKVKPDNIWLVMGGNPETAQQDTFDGSDAFITTKIPDNQTSLLTKLVPWEAGKIFYPWKPNLDSELYPYYCFYQNVLYLCLANNPNNRKDQYGDYLTSVPPSYTGTFPTPGSDGYTWLALWSLDYTKEQFLSDVDLPVPTFDFSIPSNTYTDFYNQICPNGITNSGVCCLYYKENTTNKITGMTYAAGEQVDFSVSCSCYECYDIANTLNYDRVFLNGATYSYCDSSIPTFSLKQFLQNNANKIAPNTTNAFQLNLLNDYSAHENGIMRAEIDLTNLSDSDLWVTSANPYLTVVDPHAEELAVVRLKTTQLNDTYHEVYGIELVSSGRMHIFPSYTLSSASSVLIDAITLIKYHNNIFSDPKLLVPINSYVVNSYINVGELKTTTENTNFTKIALTTDIKTRQDAALVASAPNDTTLKRLQTKIKVEVTNDGTEAGVPAADVSIINPGGGWIPPLTGYDLSTTETTASNQNTGYQFYYSSIRTGELIVNKNYGRIYRNGQLVPGYHLEVSDFTDNTAAPVAVGDSIKVLGNTCEVFEVDAPSLGKEDNEYFSVNKINLNINKMNSNVNLAFSLKVNI